jgi:hypothetical protein
MVLCLKLATLQENIQHTIPIIKINNNKKTIQKTLVSDLVIHFYRIREKAVFYYTAFYSFFK